ncbi:nuclease-related domain-containing protein [Flavobacterium wongokense]|uniref:nuclease-related domain-containing protein n=1 Tax=Flavobacterium wongokense TaxID=2910674 RepID=UPI001F38DF9E|nr:nuclease-related domain-containing protein [Flavobacterium sp. WG47]MCF6132255.1 NERD domain-containing protein [Flavobacterium sp. WG47]
MCRVYNKVGCLNAIQYHLVKNNLDDFNSLDELINFQKDYHITEKQVVLNHTLLIQQEKSSLEKDISELNDEISKSKSELEDQLKQRINGYNLQIENLPIADEVIATIKDYWLNLVIWVRIWSTQVQFHFKIMTLVHLSNKTLFKKNNRLQFIDTNFEDAVNRSSCSHLQTLQRKKAVVKEVNNMIYGAIGEQKVVKVLESLPDDYILINDFRCSFQSPIYNRRNNDYIKSVQIDHVLICPSGIFIIETKNWSKNSLEKLYLFSPVQQVRRTNYALYKIVTDRIKKSSWDFTKSHWGDRKIPMRNIIAFTNEKPTEEFELVKILGLRELLGYIKYFTPCLSPKEVQTIADFLLKMSDRQVTSSKLSI